MPLPRIKKKENQVFDTAQVLFAERLYKNTRVFLDVDKSVTEDLQLWYYC